MSATRTQVYLTEEQDRGLKGLAQSTGRKQSELIRAAIDQTHARHDAKIGGAREIAFFPPVTGG